VPVAVVDGVGVVVAEVVVFVVVVPALASLVVEAVVGVVVVVVVVVVVGTLAVVFAFEVTVGAQLTAVSEVPALASVRDADLLHLMW
jgi:hypothetical protein